MYKNEKGFSLVEVMVVLGILGGLAVVFMQFNKNISTSQSRIFSYQDLNDLNNLLNFSLTNANECKTSVEGATFKGSTIKTTPVQFEIWNSDQSGARTSKKLSATDAGLKNFGKIEITDISFLMPNYTGGDFPQSFMHAAAAEISVSAEVKSIKFKKVYKFPTYLTLSTDSSGVSTVLACGSLASMGGRLIQSVINGQYIGSGAYDYSGTKTPQFLIAEILGYGGENREGGVRVRWLNASGVVIKNWTRIRGTNIGGGNDGGSGMTDSDLATIPFLGASRIEFSPSGPHDPTINLIGLIESE